MGDEPHRIGHCAGCGRPVVLMEDDPAAQAHCFVCYRGRHALHTTQLDGCPVCLQERGTAHASDGKAKKVYKGSRRR